MEVQERIRPTSSVVDSAVRMWVSAVAVKNAAVVGAAFAPRDRRAQDVET